MKNIQVLVGEESYLIDVKINNQKNLYDKLDISTYEASETSIQTIINDCNTSSLFSDKRLVIVKNFSLDISDSDKKLLETYFDNPSPDTDLIISSYKALDKRQKFTKLLQSHKNVEYFNYDHVSDNELKDRVRNFLQDASLGIEEQALNELIVRVDSSLDRLTKELEKLSFYKDKGEYINMDDINLLVAEDINKKVFDLAKYVINKDKTSAINLYNELRLYNDEIALLALITNNIRLSYLAKKLSQYTKSDDELASLLGVNTKRLYFIKKNMYNNLYPIMERLYKLDYNIKSGAVDKSTAFMLFLME